MSATKEAQVEGLLFPMPDDLPEEHLPEPAELTPEQLAALAEAEEQEQQRRREWDQTIQALNDNSMAVVRAMRRFRNENEDEQVERVLTSYQEGSFLIDRLGAEIVCDQDLAVVLLHLRHQLVKEYGTSPAAMMLIDKAVTAYQQSIRVNGWIGNLAIRIEHEFFGREGPSAHFRDRYGREGRTLRGLTIEQHLQRLREGLVPAAERCGRMMREALAALEVLRAAPSEVVERSKPISISIRF